MRTVAAPTTMTSASVAQQREHRAVARSGQPAGLALIGGPAVEAGDHVAAHPARPQIVGVGVEVGEPAVVQRIGGP